MDKAVSFLLFFLLMDTVQSTTTDKNIIDKLPKQCFGWFVELFMYVICNFGTLKKEDTFPFLKGKAIRNVELTWFDSCGLRSVELPDKTFSQMPNIEVITILGCVKRHITSKTFEGLHHISDINIQNPNQPERYYVSFASDWLEPLTSLRSLTLSGTNALGFPSGHFCQLPHLEHLTLNKTKINSSDSLGLVGEEYESKSSVERPCLPNLTHLDISYNLIQILNVSFSTDIPNLKVLIGQSNSISQMIGLNSETITGLQELNLSNNNLSIFTMENPAKCHNSTMLRLDLHDNHLRDILPGLFICTRHLKYLNMAGNRLNETTLLDAGIQHLTELEHLNLNGNNISGLQSNMFENMTALTEFSCISCGMRFIDNNIFQKLENLAVLNLNGNFLEKFKIVSFLSSFKKPMTLENTMMEYQKVRTFFPVLNTLDLSNNEIKEFSLPLISELRYLRLAHNRITYLAKNFFYYIPKLERLDLSNNAIQFIEPGAFNLIPALQHLNLDFNNLRDEGEYWPPLSGLTHLHLRGNRMTKLPKIINGNLKWIDLSLNYISSINTFFILPQLKFVNLTYNKLYKLELQSIITIQKVRPDVYLEGNHLHCNCNNSFLKFINNDR